MSKSFKLFRDESEENKIEIKCNGISQEKEVRKIISISDKIYILQENAVFMGVPDDESHNQFNFTIFKESILDMEFWKHQIYVVTIDGKVLTKDERDDDDEWSEVNFSNDKIVSIKCNSIGQLFVSKSGILYGAGNCGDILSSDYPKRIQEITDKVINVTAGNDFFVILTVDDFPYNDNECGSIVSLVSVTSTLSDKFYRKGYDAVRTKVCTLGSRNEGGVLGTGDHIKRSHLNYIKSLEGEGVHKISSGKEHTVARTIDGRIFHWGVNSKGQIESVDKTDFSSPRELLSKRRDIVDFHCKDYRTKFVYSSDFTEPVNFHENAPLVLISKEYTLYNQPRTIQRNFEKFLISLQNAISECLHGRYFLPPPNCSDLVRELNSEFNKITMIISTILLDFEEFYYGFKVLKNISFVEFASEIIDIFETYTTKYCDCKSVAELSDEPSRILSRPIQLIESFLEFLHLSQLTDQQELFEKSSRKIRLDLELAEGSRDFWIKHWKTAPILRFKSPHRRIILDSETAPIKLVTSKYVSSNYNFILFSDIFVQYGSGLSVFTLLALWVQIEGESSIKITTPEKTFTLTTKTHMDKMLWFNQLESAIKNALGKEKEVLGKSRMISYEFSSKHQIYPKVQAYGRWTMGLLHGSCYLQYPDERFYFGHIRHGVIEGFGKMMIPAQGLYEGQFLNGKFHGYGIFEMENNRIYDGFFKDNTFHGHGVLRTSNYTYMGDFALGKESGYGILDDSVNGDKYMGMFEKGKPNGIGICIKMNGDYFEGVFSNGEITDKGVAYFSDSGNYYKGELKFKGPAGSGQYFVVSKEISEEEVEGNIIVGNLDGTWNDVKVKNGNVSIGQTFSKFPKDIGETFSKTINDSRKWKNLFDNFEEQIFGPTKLTDPNEIWNKIAIFMTTEKEKEKYKEQAHNHTASTSHGGGGYFSKNISMISNFADLSKKLGSNSDSTEKVNKSLSLNGSVSTLNLTSTSSAAMRNSSETIFEKCEKFENDFSRFYEENSFNNLLNFQFGSSRRNTDSSTSTLNSIEEESNNNSSQKLEIVPNFGITTLEASDLKEIQEYLKDAFRDSSHPLYMLNKRISTCFYTAYGCWKMKPTPILAKQALKEWESISRGVYKIVRMLFPALPETVCFIEGVCVSHVSLLYPILLSDGIYSTLFVLYANKFSEKDENYRQKLIKTEKISDENLSILLKFDHSMTKIIEDEYFKEAVNTLKLVKELYCPKEMLNIYEKSIKYLTAAFNHSYSDEPVILAADDMMPLTLFLVIRAAVPHLGAELKLLEDLIGDNNFVIEMTGLAGYCYTTITAAYEHITQSSFFQDL